MKISEPKVSVLVPVYNGERYIEEALLSILQQTYQNFEVIICDDASIDNTLNICKKLAIQDSRIKLFENSVNKGYLLTCNYLFTQVSGELVTFQDADDVSDLTRLQKQVNFFADNPKIVACGTWATYFNQNLKDIIRYKKTETVYKSIKFKMYEQHQFCGASVMFKKTVLNYIEGYQTYFGRIGSEDYDFFFRISQRWPVANIPELLYFVRTTPGSLSRSVKSPKQLISHEVVIFLAIQRDNNNGLDSLTGLDRSLLSAYEKDLLQDIDCSAAGLYRKEADRFAWQGLYKYAFISSCRALLSSPFSLTNIKYFISSFIRFIRT
jgi:glycosyltransferase involved in cell wall biosynthesis